VDFGLRNELIINTFRNPEWSNINPFRNPKSPFRNRKDIGNNKFKLKFLLFVTLRVVKVDAKSLNSRSMAAKKGQVEHYCIVHEFDSRLPFIVRKRLIFHKIWE
jgi:hypothetical protein